MYWPIGTPRIYAAITNSRASARSNPTSNVFVSHDGASIRSNTDDGDGDEDSVDATSRLLGKPDATTSRAHERPERIAPPTLDVPITPGLKTPATPAVNAVDHDRFDDAEEESQQGLSGLGITTGDTASVPSGEPILDLAVSRTGHLFAVITSTTLTIWQTKVRSPPTACDLIFS